MGLHTTTIEVIEDKGLCDTVMRAVERQYSQRYILRHFGITRRQLQRIIQFHETDAERTKEMLLTN